MKGRMIDIMILVGLLLLLLIGVTVLLKDVHEGYQNMSVVTNQQQYAQQTYTRQGTAQSVYDMSIQAQGRYARPRSGPTMAKFFGRTGRIIIRGAPGKWLNFARIKVFDHNLNDITTKLIPASKDTYNWCRHDGRFGSSWSWSSWRHEPNYGCSADDAVVRKTIDGGTGMRNFPDIYHSGSGNDTWVEYYFDNLNCYIQKIEIWNRNDCCRDQGKGTLFLITGTGQEYQRIELTGADYQLIWVRWTECPAGYYKEDNWGFGEKCIQDCKPGETLVGETCFQPCPAGFNLEGGNGGSCVRPCAAGETRSGNRCLRQCGAGESLINGTCYKPCATNETVDSGNATVCRKPCNAGDTLSGTTCLTPCGAGKYLADGKCYPADVNSYMTVWARGNLKNAHNNKCVSMPSAPQSNGGKAGMWDCLSSNEGSDQVWFFTSDNTIVNSWSRKCLDMDQNNFTNGRALQHWDCTGGGNQKWFVDYAGGIRSWTNPTKCLDTTAAGANGQQLLIWDCGSNPAAGGWQTFYIGDFPKVTGGLTGSLPQQQPMGVAFITVDKGIAYAEEGNPTALTWTGIPGGLDTISTSDGHLYGTADWDNWSIWATPPNTAVNGSHSFNRIPGGLIQVARSGKAALGVTSAGDVFYNNRNIQFEGNWVNIQGKGAYVALSGQQALVVNTWSASGVPPYDIYYSPNIFACSSGGCNWVRIQGSLGNRRIHCVDIDDTRVLAVDSRGKIYVADANISSNPNWTQIDGSVRQASMKNGRIYCVGTDNAAYYAADYRVGRWVPVAPGYRIKHISCGLLNKPPAYCISQPKRAGLHYSKRSFFYTRDECKAIGAAVGGVGTKYDAGTAQCLKNDTSNFSFSEECADKMQDGTMANLRTGVWDDGSSSGICAFHPVEYNAKYNVNSAGDIAIIRDHWSRTGITANYTPCGDINPTCAFTPSVYSDNNPDVKATKADPLTHYRTSGIQEGRSFCRAAGFVPLLDNLLKFSQDKRNVPLTTELSAACKPTSVPLTGGGSANRYLCNTRENAEALLRGPSNPAESYLGRQDTVCYTVNAEKGVYGCKTVLEDRNGYDYTSGLMDSYQLMCDNIVKNMADLDKTIDTLTSMQGNMTDGGTALRNAVTQLTTMQGTLNCSATTTTANPRLKAACDALAAGVTQINQFSGNVGTGLGRLTDPVATITGSRTSLMKLVTEMGCDYEKASATQTRNASEVASA